MAVEINQYHGYLRCQTCSKTRELRRRLTAESAVIAAEEFALRHRCMARAVLRRPAPRGGSEQSADRWKELFKNIKMPSI